MHALHWTAYTGHLRFSALQEVEKIINQYGFIANFKEFSDLTINIEIEIEPSKIEGLHKALSDYLTIDEPVEIGNLSTIYLNLTFGAGTGDLKIPVPEVPG
ncbi:MAG TPA: hypothetical protein VGF79_03880 [Bacteroidia bacterium]